LKITRPMRQDDLPAVLQIEKQVFSSPWPEDAFSSSDFGESWVICEDATLVGYIMYHNVIDESVIINLAVDPAYQRKGYGKELLENTLNQLTDRGFTHFYLDVRVSNQAALALYEGFGFQRVGLRKGYYTLPDEDAYVMAMIVKREVI